MSVPLRPSAEQNVWTGTVANEEWLRNSQFLLAIAAQMGVDDLIRKVPQLVKLASSEEIQHLIRHALPGVTLRHLPAPPTAVTFRADTQYFSINQAGRLWEAIAHSRNVSVHIPPEVVEPRAEILVVLP